MTMTTAQMTVLVGRDTSVSTIVARLIGTTRQIVARRRAAADYRKLLEAEDCILLDIGVTRGEVMERLTTGR